MSLESVSISNAEEDAMRKQRLQQMGTGCSLFLATVDTCAYYISTLCLRGDLNQAKSKQKLAIPYTLATAGHCMAYQSGGQISRFSQE